MYISYLHILLCTFEGFTVGKITLTNYTKNYIAKKIKGRKFQQRKFLGEKFWIRNNKHTIFVNADTKVKVYKYTLGPKK